MMYEHCEAKIDVGHFWHFKRVKVTTGCLSDLLFVPLTLI